VGGEGVPDAEVGKEKTVHSNSYVSPPSFKAKTKGGGGGGSPFGK